MTRADKQPASPDWDKSNPAKRQTEYLTGPIGGPPEARGPMERRRDLNPLIQLTLARWREFLREPEAVFWVFVFPVLLAFALGIAFRNTAPAKTLVAVEIPSDPGSN